MRTGEEHPPRIQNKKMGRHEMEHSWQTRQQNILPHQTASNTVEFYGRALKGTSQLSRVQRIGIVLIGTCFLGTAAIFLALTSVGPSLKSIYAGLPDISLVSLPTILLGLILGLRLCWVAFKRPPRSRRQ